MAVFYKGVVKFRVLENLFSNNLQQSKTYFHARKSLSTNVGYKY